MITLSELPMLPWSNSRRSCRATTTLDGTVNTADYTMWRDSLGESGSGLAADGNGDGKIDDGGLRRLEVVLRRVDRRRGRIRPSAGARLRSF